MTAKTPRKAGFLLFNGANEKEAADFNCEL
jgi:hypothetical protein